MGAIFQLVIVSIFYCLLACIIGFMLVILAKVITLFKQNSAISISQFFWFPLKLAPYFLLALIINILICQFVRDVDPPLTDYWSLPISGDLTLGAIDITDKWYLWPSRNGGEAIVSDIVKVGINDKAVYGVTEYGAYFIYWFNFAQKEINLTRADFKSSIKGMEAKFLSLKHPSEYYYEQRNFGDLMTLLFVLIYPLFYFYKLCFAFYHAVKTNDRMITSN